MEPNSDELNLQSWKYDVKYCGGHTLYRGEANGKLCLFGEPLYKVNFKCPEFVIEVSLDKIKATRVVDQASFSVLGIGKRETVIIDFDDSSSYLQSPAFEFVIKRASETQFVEEFTSNLYQLRMNFLEALVRNSHRSVSSGDLNASPAFLSDGHKNNSNLICPKCTSHLASMSSFCPVCGADIRQEFVKQDSKEKILQICPQCKNRIESKAKFCPECGASLQTSL